MSHDSLYAIRDAACNIERIASLKSTVEVEKVEDTYISPYYAAGRIHHLSFPTTGIPFRFHHGVSVSLPSAPNADEIPTF